MENNMDIPNQEIVNEFVGAAHANFERVQALLAEYPELLNMRAEWGEGAIEAASQTGNILIAEFLLAHGAPLDICTAAMLGMNEKVREMLDANPDLNQAVGAHGIPLMYFPIIRGHKEIAELLLARGACVNGLEGVSTPLHGAISFGQADLARWLVQHGADLNSLDFENKSPLQRAEEKGLSETVELLRINLTHQPFIRQALKLAVYAGKHGNHTFGALLVHAGRVILTAENTVNTDKDNTRHAELNLIAKAGRELSSEVIRQCILYTSTAPCLMCTATIWEAGITRIVHSVSYEAFAKLIPGGYKYIPCTEIYRQFDTPLEWIGPILEFEGLDVYKFWPKN